MRELREIPPSREPRGTTCRPVIKYGRNGRRSTIIRAVSHFYFTSFRELLSGGQTDQLVKARAVLCWLLYHEVGMTTSQIGALFHRSNSGVSQQIKRAHERYRRDIDKLLVQLEQR